MKYLSGKGRRFLAGAVLAFLLAAACISPLEGSRVATAAMRMTPDTSAATLQLTLYGLLDRIASLRDALRSQLAGNVLGVSTAGNQFLWSKSPDRSNPVPLAGATVSGAIYAFAQTGDHITRVEFYLDDPRMTRPPLRTEIAPFDLGGGATDVAYPFTTQSLPDGAHTATAKLIKADGQFETLWATFTVANQNPPSPAPTLTPSPAPSPTAGGQPAAEHHLYLSASPNKSNSVFLHGQTVSGPVYIFTGPNDQGVSRVRFYLDDPERRGQPVLTETAPFDLGGSATGAPSAYQTRSLANGEHVITAAMDLHGGALRVISARFQVNNGGGGTIPAPAPSQPPSPTSVPAPSSPAPAPTSVPPPTPVPPLPPLPPIPTTSPIPASDLRSIPLGVGEHGGISRNGEVVSSGVPLPQVLNLRDTSRLRVVNASGQPIPAQFRVLARWHGGVNDASRPIQWVLVTFPAGVSANAVGSYHLLTDASVANPAPATPLAVSQQGNRVTVNTGAATFVVGPSALFDEVKTAAGERLVSGGALSATINGRTAEADNLRSVTIRSSGPLVAVVEVKGTYGLSFGDGAISFTRRYEFEAGSPTAIVRHVVDWEGSLAGMSWWATGQTPSDFNFIEGQRLRDTLNLAFTPSSVRAVSSRDATNDIPYTGQEVALRTLLRRKGADGLAARWQPRRFELTSGNSLVASGARDGLRSTGKVADGGMLAIQGPGGTLGIALDHMHNYEPQALRVLPGGKAAIDIADDKFPLAFRQGLFASMAVSALPANASRADMDQKVWAPLNQPLRALPTAKWLNQTEAWNKIPAGTLPSRLSSYSALMPRLLDNTLAQQEKEGLHGLMTTGLWPRYWAEWPANPSQPSSEVDGGGNGDWDGLFRDTTWTDYYSTTAVAPMWSISSGNSKYIGELGVPAALRTLHTQIIQGAPNDPNSYVGQGSHGYGGFRADFNSKHHYWDNVYLYYFLTGDESAVDVLQRGGMNQLVRYRQGNSGVVGAPSALWLAAWRFLGNTVVDPAVASQFVEGFREAAGRIITDHYAELSYQGELFGFTSEDYLSPGTFNQTSQWTVGGFDMENVYWLMKMTNDAPVGPNGITPSRMMRMLAKGMVKVLPSPSLRYVDGTLLGGDGTIEGPWAREIKVSYTGPKVGGTVTSIVAVDKVSEKLLFPGDKPYMAAFFSQAAKLGADPAVGAMAKSLVSFGLPRMNGMVLGKLAGLGVNRLVTAVAEEAGF